MIIFKASMEKQTHRSKQCLTHRKNSKNYGKTLVGSLNRLDDYLADYEQGTRGKVPTKLKHNKLVSCHK